MNDLERQRYDELVKVLTANGIHFIDLRPNGERFFFYSRHDGDSIVEALDRAGADAGWNESYQVPMYIYVTVSMRSWRKS